MSVGVLADKHQEVTRILKMAIQVQMEKLVQADGLVSLPVQVENAMAQETRMELAAAAIIFQEVLVMVKMVMPMEVVVLVVQLIWLLVLLVVMVRLVLFGLPMSNVMFL